jgi:S-adenosylmethionine:tRNA ribosyltransferase-isomerase
MTAPLLALHVDAVGDFELPDECEATGPPESRGLERDGVRLMVATHDGLRHRRFRDLVSELCPGDLIVVNNSKTLPASVVVDGSVVFHFSTRLPGGLVVVEPRILAGVSSERWPDPRRRRFQLPGGMALNLLTPFPFGSESNRLWLSSVETDQGLDDYLLTWGRPIRYSYVDAPYPLEAYQTVFASVPGSAEMPSAGRPFSGRVVASLVGAGVSVAPVTLHTGVSSLESGEPPYPEWFEISEMTAALVNHVRTHRGRVVAVGTTVARALESSVDRRGAVRPLKTWTDLVIGAGHTMGAIDGLITGWHEPRSTHLAILQSLAGRSLVSNAYAEALDSGYLWHEFGDSLLLLSE